ncbi:LOW QUALITY PROTEIN: Fc receptor-like protein 5 [Micropterus salmoides]|uniref:LOW QUALITY PROTEIN: Fc receptor-like protein 5 n=1 Tax=Micropterus salmoides TaxID=27706 RepID=UPI0018EC2F2E|nr:LOW QUALITY PROTEIN: Fc receptor-like protein 5 [Micropterus salmoides]
MQNTELVQSQNDWGVTYTSTEICAFKGSTVDMSCTYRYPSRINGNDTTVEKTFWFKGDEIVDLKTKSEYSGRVTYIFNENCCTLRITDLRESDSAEYKFRFITNQPGGKYTGSPGVTLSVTDLQVQVSRLQVYESSNWAELKCHSSCSPGHPSYIWYKNGQNISEGTSYSAYFDPADSFSCAVGGYEKSRSPSVYAPKLPSVSVSPSAEIVEGSSVTLTCSSDANPAATYTWYKEKGNLNHLHPRNTKTQLVFGSIQSSDSGKYYCAAENELGRKKSESVFIDVKYAPKLPSVSVSPSAEIVEGSSVTLTCSSDANPAAKYTWYKENEDSPKASGQNFTITDFRAEHSGNYYCEAQNRRGRHNSTLHLIVVADAPKLPSVSVSPSAEIVEGSSVTLTCSSDANPAANYTWYKEKDHEDLSKESQLVFSSIQSSDSGEYYCAAENQLGRKTTEYIFINVKYAPKLPSVSVSPSAEIVEGSSVTLTCSSDANPAANYTWYKENEDSPKASGQNFTITDFRAEHSGNYYCEAQNRRGRHNSTLHLIVVAESPEAKSE